MNPATVTLANGAATSTMTILTKATSRAGLASFPSRSHSLRPAYALWLPFMGVVLSGFVVSVRSKEKRSFVAVVAALLFAILFSLIACGGGNGKGSGNGGGSGGGGGAGTPPGSYNMVVTGYVDDGNYNTATVRLNVQ
jgi:hypothetical protein